MRGYGLCLTTLAQQRNTTTPDSVLKARQKIGLGEFLITFSTLATDFNQKIIRLIAGVTLSRESDGVWIYNRSTLPVFVHSPTLYDMDTRYIQVYKVPPGHCLRAFDPVK